MSEEIHLNDIGTIFRFTVKDGSAVLDISGASTKNIVFKKPTGATLTKAGSFFTDGTDGILQYTTLTGDLDTLRIWQAQVSLVLAAGTWKTDVVEFTVHENL